jgi:hypothetical protein
LGRNTNNGYVAAVNDTKVDAAQFPPFGEPPIAPLLNVTLRRTPFAAATSSLQ